MRYRVNMRTKERFYNECYFEFSNLEEAGIFVDAASAAAQQAMKIDIEVINDDEDK